MHVFPVCNLKLLLGRCWRIYEGFTNWLINDWKRTKWQALNFSSRAARAPIPLVLQKQNLSHQTPGAKKLPYNFNLGRLRYLHVVFCNILSPWSCCVYCVASVCLLWIFTSHSWHANLHMPSNMKSTSLNKRRTSAKDRGPKLPMVIFRQVVVFKTVWYQALKCQNRDTVKVQWTNCTTALSFCAHCQWMGETETSQAIQCELVLM